MNEEKFSCIRTVDKTVKIPLWDMYTTTEYKGIEAALDKWKRQYEKQVGGIVVNYKNVSIPSRLGFHSDRGSYAIYNVRATFDVFCPRVGEIVKGKINRVSSEHIGCLIAETINVSIRLPRDSPSGLSKYIYLDREILFEIRSFSCKPRALCVNGEVTAKCVELMDEYYPVADEFSYEPTSQAVFGDVPSDAEDLQVNLAILGTDGKKKNGKKRARDETEEEEDGTGSPRVKKIKKDLDLTGSQEEEASSTDTPKKGKKSSTDSSKLKKSKKGLISTNSPGAAQVYGDTSSTDTPKKGKKHKMNSPKPKKSLISANGPEMTQEGGDTSSEDTSKILKKEGATDSPKVKQIQRLQDESSSIDTPKKAKKKKSSSTDSPKASQEDSSSTESAKKMAPKSTDSSQESQSSSTESDKKEKEKSSNKKAKKKASKSTESPTKIKRELLSSTEDEGSKKKSKKKPKKKSKDSAKSKDKKKSSKKKGKVTASGDILKKDKKKSKKSSKKDDKSKKKSKKDKSEKKKKPKLSNDGDVTLKEIKSEGM